MTPKITNESEVVYATFSESLKTHLFLQSGPKINPYIELPINRSKTCQRIVGFNVPLDTL